MFRKKVKKEKYNFSKSINIILKALDNLHEEEINDLDGLR